MERLTRRDKVDGNEFVRINKGAPDFIVYEKLAEYEDLEEQGKLLNLPCAVGDTVYADSGVLGVLEYEVDSIVIDSTITYQCSAYSEPVGDCPGECLDEIETDISDFGKTVFLTQEEAESAIQRGYIYKINTYQFYSEEQNRMITGYRITQKQPYRKKNGEMSEKYVELLNSCSQVEVLKWLVEEWEKRKNETEMENSHR